MGLFGKSLKCPKCWSHNIEVMNDGKKSLSAGKALIGGSLFGPAGLVVGGMMGSKGKYELLCRRCGHRWKSK